MINLSIGASPINYPVLVTGGTGFIGRYVVAKLLAEGRQVRLPYRNSLPSEWHEDSRIDLIKVDDLAVTVLEPLVEGCAAVVHLAGLAHGGKADRVDTSLKFAHVNDELTSRLVTAARHLRDVNFVYLSSLAAVTPNASNDIINDFTNIAPTTPYGQSKRAAEQYVRRLSKDGTFAVSLRPPSQMELIEARRAYGLYAIRPGITGIAQVAGIDMSEPQRLAEVDATYLDNMQLSTNLRLIVVTVFGAGRGDRVRP